MTKKLLFIVLLVFISSCKDNRMTNAEKESAVDSCHEHGLTAIDYGTVIVCMYREPEKKNGGLN